MLETSAKPLAAARYDVLNMEPVHYAPSWSDRARFGLY